MAGDDVVLASDAERERAVSMLRRNHAEGRLTTEEFVERVRHHESTVRTTLAAILAALGIDVDCLPIADVPVAGSNPVIGDRAYGANPVQVAAIAEYRPFFRMESRYL